MEHTEIHVYTNLIEELAFVVHQNLADMPVEDRIAHLFTLSLLLRSMGRGLLKELKTSVDLSIALGAALDEPEEFFLPSAGAINNILH